MYNITRKRICPLWKKEEEEEEESLEEASRWIGMPIHTLLYVDALTHRTYSWHKLTCL